MSNAQNDLVWPPTLSRPTHSLVPWSFARELRTRLQGSSQDDAHRICALIFMGNVRLCLIGKVGQVKGQLVNIINYFWTMQSRRNTYGAMDRSKADEDNWALSLAWACEWVLRIEWSGVEWRCSGVAMLKTASLSWVRKFRGGGGQRRFLLLTWATSTILALRLHIVHSCRWKRTVDKHKHAHIKYTHPIQCTQRLENEQREAKRENKWEGIFEAHGMIGETRKNNLGLISCKAIICWNHLRWRN